MAGALTPRVLAVVTTISHHEQWSKASFKARGEEGRTCSDLLKIGMAM
jgi:hypothetical protein